MKVRTAARRWHVGDRYGAPGDTFFFLMSNAKQFEKTWRCDEQGWRTYTLLRCGIRSWTVSVSLGLISSQEETPPDEQGMDDMASFRDTLMALSGNQAAEAQLYQTDNT